MGLSETINADIKKAMLAREKGELEALRAVKAAIMLEATKDGGGEVSEDSQGLEGAQAMYDQQQMLQSRMI